MLDKLQKLSEKKLTEAVVFPLLETMGFDHIEERHGPYEKGKDILCLRRDELDELELLAIQVKKLKFSGNASESGHLHNVINQLSQCLEEPIKLRDGTERPANRVWFISPYPLNISALEASFAKYVRAGASRVKIMDGAKLLDLLEKNAPEVLAQLGDKYAAYITNLKGELTFLQEASAFRLRDKISILPIYIDLDISVLPPRLLAVIGNRVEPKSYVRLPYKSTVGTRSELRAEVRRFGSLIDAWEDFEEKAQSVLGFGVVKVLDDVRKYDFLKDGQQQWKKKDVTAAVGVHWEKIFAGARELALGQFDLLKREPSAKNMLAFHEIVNRLDGLLNHNAVNPLIRITSNVSNLASDFDRVGISIEHLLESRMNCQITGEAGAGKTTLLRMIGYKEVSNKTGRIPVFVPLASLTPKLTIKGLIQKTCKQHGIAPSKRSFDDLLSGGRLLLLLDGVDEAASRIKQVNSEIAEFMSEQESVQCVFTARPWARLGRRADFITLRLLPFTPDQVKAFFYRWFADSPTQAEEVIDHLDEHPYLYEVVSTPLIATILAVVKLYGQGLPTSLLGLYERRFELLLHNWDSAKGIKRDVFSFADKLFFIRKLAFQLHKQTVRSAPWDMIVRLIFQTLGGIHSIAQAEEFARELVQHNNVLIQDEDGNWGLGHLQYQEYLAALEAKENPKINLANYIEGGWWSAVLQMYAEMTSDISLLILNAHYQYGDKVEGLQRREDILYKLSALLPLAPNTEESAKAIVEKGVDTLEAIGDSFSRYSSDAILQGKGRPR